MYDIFEQLFSYDPLTGIMRRKVATSNRVRVGDIVGARKQTHKGKPYSKIYLQVRVNGRLTYVHIIAYVIMTKKEIEPGLMIDHLDGDGTNNKWENIRLATPSQNMGNRTRNRTRVIDLPKGVYFHRRDNLYVARLCDQTLGYFKEASAAKSAYDAKSTEYYGDFHKS